MTHFVCAAHLEQEISALLEAQAAVWLDSFCAFPICAKHSVQPGPNVITPASHSLVKYFIVVLLLASFLWKMA